MPTIQLYTIGFTQKSAEAFFSLLQEAGVRRVVDVRLSNTSQLAAFAKRDDLVYFLREIVGIDYVHVPELAPTKEIFDAYKKHKGAWEVFEQEYLELLEKRRIDESVARDVIDQGCLLCSEHQPHHCHRRLVAEYLDRRWGDVNTEHLV